MAESESPLSRDRLESEFTSEEEPLGVKNPLLPVNSLGLNQQFIVPLGARSLSVLDPSIFLSRYPADTLFDSLFADSPFFSDLQLNTETNPSSETPKSNPQPIVQPQRSPDSDTAQATNIEPTETQMVVPQSTISLQKLPDSATSKPSIFEQTDQDSNTTNEATEINLKEAVEPSTSLISSETTSPNADSINQSQSSVSSETSTATETSTAKFEPDVQPLPGSQTTGVRQAPSEQTVQPGSTGILQPPISAETSAAISRQTIQRQPLLPLSSDSKLDSEQKAQNYQSTEQSPTVSSPPMGNEPHEIQLQRSPTSFQTPETNAERATLPQQSSSAAELLAATPSSVIQSQQVPQSSELSQPSSDPLNPEYSAALDELEVTQEVEEGAISQTSKQSTLSTELAIIQITEGIAIAPKLEYQFTDSKIVQIGKEKTAISSLEDPSKSSELFTNQPSDETVIAPITEKFVSNIETVKPDKSNTILLRSEYPDALTELAILQSNEAAIAPKLESPTLSSEAITIQPLEETISSPLESSAMPVETTTTVKLSEGIVNTSMSEELITSIRAVENTSTSDHQTINLEAVQSRRDETIAPEQPQLTQSNQPTASLEAHGSQSEVADTSAQTTVGAIAEAANQPLASIAESVTPPQIQQQSEPAHVVADNAVPTTVSPSASNAPNVSSEQVERSQSLNSPNQTASVKQGGVNQFFSKAAQLVSKTMAFFAEDDAKASAVQAKSQQLSKESEIQSSIAPSEITQFQNDETAIELSPESTAVPSIESCEGSLILSEGESMRPLEAIEPSQLQQREVASSAPEDVVQPSETTTQSQVQERLDTLAVPEEDVIQPLDVLSRQLQSQQPKNVSIMPEGNIVQPSEAIARSELPDDLTTSVPPERVITQSLEAIAQPQLQQQRDISESVAGENAQSLQVSAHPQQQYEDTSIEDTAVQSSEITAQPLPQKLDDSVPPEDIAIQPSESILQTQMQQRKDNLAMSKGDVVESSEAIADPHPQTPVVTPVENISQRSEVITQSLLRQRNDDLAAPEHNTSVNLKADENSQPEENLLQTAQADVAPQDRKHLSTSTLPEGTVLQPSESNADPYLQKRHDGSVSSEHDCSQPSEVVAHSQLQGHESVSGEGSVIQPLKTVTQQRSPDHKGVSVSSESEVIQPLAIGAQSQLETLNSSLEENVVQRSEAIAYSQLHDKLNTSVLPDGNVAQSLEPISSPQLQGHSNASVSENSDVAKSVEAIHKQEQRSSTVDTIQPSCAIAEPAQVQEQVSSIIDSAPSTAIEGSISTTHSLNRETISQSDVLPAQIELDTKTIQQSKPQSTDHAIEAATRSIQQSPDALTVQRREIAPTGHENAAQSDITTAQIESDAAIAHKSEASPTGYKTEQSNNTSVQRSSDTITDSKLDSIAIQQNVVSQSGVEATQIESDAAIVQKSDAILTGHELISQPEVTLTQPPSDTLTTQTTIASSTKHKTTLQPNVAPVQQSLDTLIYPKVDAAKLEHEITPLAGIASAQIEFNAAIARNPEIILTEHEVASQPDTTVQQSSEAAIAQKYKGVATERGMTPNPETVVDQVETHMAIAPKQEVTPTERKIALQPNFTSNQTEPDTSIPLKSEVLQSQTTVDESVAAQTSQVENINLSAESNTQQSTQLSINQSAEHSAAANLKTETDVQRSAQPSENQFFEPSIKTFEPSIKTDPVIESTVQRSAQPSESQPVELPTKTSFEIEWNAISTQSKIGSQLQPDANKTDISETFALDQKVDHHVQRQLSGDKHFNVFETSSSDLPDLTSTPERLSQGAEEQPESIPLLPQVLQSLTVLQPLTPKPTSDAANSQILQPKGVSNISLALSANPASADLQPFLDESATPNSVNVPKADHHSTASTNSSLSSASSQWSDFNELMNGRTKPVRQLRKTNALQDSTVVQAQFSNPSTSNWITKHQSLRSVMEEQESSDVEDVNDDLDGVDYLETLAQAIYDRLRQRIRVEQERHGRDYSGRLPW